MALHTLEETQVGPMSAPPLEPEVALPVDEGLPGFLRLFDNEWVWQAFCEQFGTPEELPQRIRPNWISYQLGARALVSYVAERQWDHWITEDQFAIELVAGKAERLFRYPKDPYLPGLRRAASPIDAHELLAKHVPVSPHILRVEAVRYRPGSRAVLRHIVSLRRGRPNKVTLFVRVMRPRRVDRLMEAAELMEHSGFALPRLAGCWTKGGVVWLARIPGKTVRTLIQKGRAPDPEPILDGLEKLWSTPINLDQGHP